MSKSLEEIVYDENVKRFLSQKIILAHILVSTVKEFFEMSIEEVMSLIEEPTVSTVKVDAEGNVIKDFIKSGSRIVGVNSEDSSKEEGTIFYDIKFVVYCPSEKQKLKMYIDVEAQNRYNPGYNITKRGVYYCSRMISSQKEIEFTKSEYDDIKKVYSIWICTDCPTEIENSITEISLQQRNLVGCVPDTKEYDLFGIIVVGLSEKIATEASEYKLHRLLEAFFSATLVESDKRKIIEKEYGIPYSNEIERSVSQMCNVSQGILERGRIEGKIELLLEQGNSSQEIAEKLNISVDKVEHIISALEKSDN